MRDCATRGLRAIVGSMALAATAMLHAQPLTPPEFQAVLGEVRAMLATDEEQVTQFVVREAIPARIERFYATPELAALPLNVRENGLIFGGLGGQLLAFERPSDVLAKLERWFPAELAAIRQRRASINHIRLWGPYENWQPEPRAFVALWKCYPQGAWLRPEQQPFARLAPGGRELLPWALSRWA